MTEIKKKNYFLFKYVNYKGESNDHRNYSLHYLYDSHVGVLKKGSTRMVLVKLTLEELELLIEVMERNRIDNDNENDLRHDLRSIREQVEEKKNRLAEEMAKRPQEEMRLIPNPTSAEHIE